MGPTCLIDHKKTYKSVLWQPKGALEVLNVPVTSDKDKTETKSSKMVQRSLK